MEKEKLEPIFKFINKHREFNKRLQNRYYKSIVMPHTDIREKVMALLYQIANTQSQPNIDNLAIFYKSLYEDEDKEVRCLDSLASFIEKLSGKRGNSFSELFLCLKNQRGWGEKTSALFVKSIFHLHNNKYDSSLKIWDDVPLTIENTDSLKLPVDAVINHIFSEIGLKNPGFSNINSLLSEHYKGEQMEVWDDLWFWGFITQKGSGVNRKLEWNENKYWVLEHSSKCPYEIEEIIRLSTIFINIIKGRND